ncbi:serine/threonine kinase [Fragilaria crotonensis]|nr:serine/threonine kinase [Fragilaria crotonensis]
MPLSDNDVALIFNAFKGNLNEVRALLLDGANVNAQRDSDGATALYVASQNGHLEVVRELLQIDDVDVNLRSTDDGSTALYIASNEGHVDVVRALLQHDNVDVNILGSDDCDTALHAAILGGLEVFRELLQHSKVNVNAKNKDGDTVLSIASQHNNLDVVGILLQNEKVDVNAKNKNGETALFKASREGYQEAVKTLLEHNTVDVNLPCNTGATPLHIASQYDRGDVVRELLQNSKVNANLKDNDELTAFEVAQKHNKFAAIKAFRDEIETLEEVNKNRESLAKVMKTCKAEPVELSYNYIKHCIKMRKLGSGASGDVFLVEDRDLPESKKFAVKMIKLSQSSDGPNDEIWVSFQRELSTLKRFRHPNIIVLYGYNFEGRAGEQFLVYEYAANGSLDCFLKDDDKRALLPADKRLSIMYQVANAVHSLHTGAAGVKVYHRDIKSANICLMKDFTPKLIGCGLAKFVLDRHEAVPSESIQQSGSTQGTAIGTHLYRCPEYISKKGKGINCDYIPAYDVYSFGVVMAELILGRLNDGKRTNVLQTYVLNEETPIVDGWKQLKNHADGRADWNAEALELVCKTVIGCITLPSERRLSTDKLRDLLKHATNKQDKYSDIEPKDAIAELDKILDNTDKRNSEPECVAKVPCCNCDKPLLL